MSHWELVCIVGAVLWTLQTLALAFWFLPNAAERWAWQGYWLGRKHQRNGDPVPDALLPLSRQELAQRTGRRP